MIKDVVTYSQETGTEHVMIFTDAQMNVWNQLTIEKSLVKPFCEKKFTEFLARVEKMVSIFTSSPHKISLQGKNFEGNFSRQKWGGDKNTLRFRISPLAR